MKALRIVTAAIAAAALIGCAGQATDVGSVESSTIAAATPAHVFVEAVTCAQATTALGLSDTYTQALIDTNPMATFPYDIGGGDTATLSFLNAERKLFSWVATTNISLVLVRGDWPERTSAYVYDPATMSSGGILGAYGGANVEYVKLCYVPEPPPPGCTLTQGYWKTHSAYGPAPYDDLWAEIGEDTTFFLSAQSYHAVLWTQPAGNAYYILAHQYIAAELNALAGASLGDLQDEFDAATSFFQTHTPAAVAASKTLKAEATYLGGKLGAWNEGSTGPGHCDEEDEPYRPE